MKKIYKLICLLLFTGGFATNIQAQTTFTVTTGLDNGNNATPTPGSLREAINNANTTANGGGGPDVIQFNIPGGGVQIVGITNNPLPTITESVTIDGYSQPGSVQGQVGGGTRVINVGIDGDLMPSGDGLTVDASDVTISGIAVYNFNGNGITLANGASSRNHFFVWGCNIGLDASGSIPGAETQGRLGNANHGINVVGGANIHSNIHIGSDLSGTNDANEGNVISSNNPSITNNNDGVYIENAINSNVSGNYLGVDGTGNGAAKNGRNGVNFVNCAPANASQLNLIGTNGDNVNDAIEGNIISNNGNGVAMLNANYTTVAGNIIGLFKNGNAAGNIPNGIIPLGSGVIIWGSTNNTIGVNGDGSAGEANEKNFICSNLWNGVTIYDQGGIGGAPINNRVSGNSIGVGLDGVTAHGNTNFGVGFVSNTASGAFNNIIGSDDNGTSDALEANVIANNGVDGTGIFTTHAGSTAGNRFSRNSYYANGRFAINLNLGTCPSPNQGAPSSPSSFLPNDLYDHPVLENVILGVAASITFTGWALPGSTIQFYKVEGVPNNPCSSIIQFQEGKTYLVSATEGSGSDADAATSAYTQAQEGTFPGSTFTANRFSFTIPAANLAAPITGGGSGDGIEALAISDGVGTTSALGSTSQFSGMVVATGVLPVTLLYFDAKAAAGNVNLHWATGTESNSDHFEIERSADGIHFSSVGSVNAKGNSSTTTEYNFVDGNPLNGVSYYRLRQVDRDGQYVFSNTVVIRSSGGGSNRVLISPNPARGNTVISLSLSKAEVLQVRLIDNMGRTAKTYNVSGMPGMNQFYLNDLSNMPSGVYNLEITGNTTRIRERLVKN